MKFLEKYLEKYLVKFQAKYQVRYLAKYLVKFQVKYQVKNQVRYQAKNQQSQPNQPNLQKYLRALGLLRAEKGVSSLTKVKIIEMMLDRTFGKPDTAVKVTTEQQSVEEAQAELEAIFGVVAADPGDGVVH